MKVSSTLTIFLLTCLLNASSIHANNHLRHLRDFWGDVEEWYYDKDDESDEDDNDKDHDYKEKKDSCYSVYYGDSSLLLSVEDNDNRLGYTPAYKKVSLNDDNEKHWVYRDDLLLEEYKNGKRRDKCLSIDDDDKLSVKDCDSDKTNQMWLFARVPVEDSSHYLIISVDNKRVLKYDDDKSRGITTKPLSDVADYDDEYLFALTDKNFFAADTKFCD